MVTRASENAHRPLEGGTYALCSMRCMRRQGDDRGGEVSEVQPLARPSRWIRGIASSGLLLELRFLLPGAVGRMQVVPHEARPSADRAEDLARDRRGNRGGGRRRVADRQPYV